MKTIINTINGYKQLSVAVCVVFFSIMTLTNIANAATVATVAKIKLSTASPSVGQTVTFSGSTSICGSTTGCSYTWQWYWRSPDGTTTHVGGQMGRTPVVRYKFSAFAAGKPYIIVALTVGEGRVRKSSTATVAFKVLAK
jgi:hypothetical protein